MRVRLLWDVDTPQLHLVNEASHTVLLEAGVSLADILKERNLLPPEEGYPLDRMAPVPAISALISREQAKMAAHASTQVRAPHPVSSCSHPHLSEPARQASNLPTCRKRGVYFGCVGVHISP